MVYVLLLMALTAMSVVLSVFILKLHHRPSDKPLGRRATKIIIFLQKLMCSQDQRLPVITEIKRSSQDDEAVSTIDIHRKHKNKTTAVVPYDNNQEADDSRCGSALSSQRSAQVSDVSGQQSAETLSTLLFYFSLLFLVIKTIVFIIILVVGGARQEENTRFT
ncbi:uncharacterized protein LOC112575345 [Pomacea canaliculata]|uniref:uncharacterized protein LOC112575345 n=1 Tax=Pomacea canaliculata TaxID=400727 RepID=UPI000D7383C0|nr:uncharacterized protein LOC112575345 [Pomacea canaliculata]